MACRTGGGLIVVYVSASPEKKVDNQQNHIEAVLRGQHVQYEMIDVATSPALQDEMRKKCGDNSALVPQIFSGDQYCGDYKSFQQATQEDRILKFLKLS